MKKWTLICVEGDSWPEVVSSVREWAKEIAIASSAPVPKEPPPWVLSGKGMMWAGTGNRPDLDKLSALVNPTNARPAPPGK